MRGSKNYKGGIDPSRRSENGLKNSTQDGSFNKSQRQIVSDMNVSSTPGQNTFDMSGAPMQNSKSSKGAARSRIESVEHTNPGQDYSDAPGMPDGQSVEDGVMIDSRSNDKKTMLLVTNDVDEAILLADRIVPLKPGPNATMGKEFVVDLERPRDRTALNHDARFKELRNEVVSYLNQVRNESREEARNARTKPKVELPKLEPADLRAAG